MLRRLLGTLYFWVLLGVGVGMVVGFAAPGQAVTLKIFGDIFLKLLKMMIAPIIFTTIVLGLAGMRDMKSVGRIGVKTLVYFELLTTIALAIGLVFVNLLRPGAGFHVAPGALDQSAVAAYVAQSHVQTMSGYLQNIVPTTLFAGLANGEMLQVLLVAVLVGFAVASLGSRAAPLVVLIEALSAVLLKLLSMLMWLAPIGVLGAMAYTVGAHGLRAVSSLGALLGVFYLTCLVFIFGVLGIVCRMVGVSVWRLIIVLKTEILTAFGTASSESVLAPVMKRLESIGCARHTVGLVVPAGYSFNMDGACIYLTVSAVFLAQALDIPLGLGQQLGLLAIAMLTSKGATGVSGSGFVVLATTLATVPGIPVASIAIILGIDRFMNEGRTVTNLIGNAVAALAISAWEGELDRSKLHAALGMSREPRIDQRPSAASG